MMEPSSSNLTRLCTFPFHFMGSFFMRSIVSGRPRWKASLAGRSPFRSQPQIVDLEQVLAARLKCDLDSALTPSPVAFVEVGQLLRRSTEIGEQSAHCLRALDAYLRAEHSAVVEGRSLQRETSAIYEVHTYVAGLEKRSGHQAPTALRILLFASLADDLGFFRTWPGNPHLSV
jgi:hypothetical protein